MNEVQVKVKKLHPDAVIPQYSHLFDAGFDLVAVDDVIIEPGQTVKVPTGLAFAIPPGFELQIRPRSGISSKTKLRISNSPGTCDAGFRGEVQVLIDNVEMLDFTVRFDEDGVPYIGVNKGVTYDVKGEDALLPYGENWHGSYIVRKGDRIAQGVIAPVYKAGFEVVDDLDETERGTGGFGSSGVTA